MATQKEIIFLDKHYATSLLDGLWDLRYKECDVLTSYLLGDVVFLEMCSWWKSIHIAYEIPYSQ